MGWEPLRGIVKEEEGEGLWTRLEGQDRTRAAHCHRDSAGLSPAIPSWVFGAFHSSHRACPMDG